MSILSKKELLLYKKASKSLLFDDLFELVLQRWPKQIDTSRREYVRYEKMRGVIHSLGEIEEANQAVFETLGIGNLLVHLNHTLFEAIHKIGLVQDVVRPKEISKEYIRYFFEKKKIGYAMETDLEKIPVGLRGAIDDIYDRNLIRQYFRQMNSHNHGQSQ